MSIYTHPDGYLQITEGHNIQDVSEGSIMWRLFRGWNQRRQAIGYGALAYIGTEFVPVENIDEAKINSGANLQNYLFWRKLQSLNEIISPGGPFPPQQFRRSFLPIPAGDTYAGYVGFNKDAVMFFALFFLADPQQFQYTEYDRVLLAPTFIDFNYDRDNQDWLANIGELTGGYIAPGSLLNLNAINGLLRAMHSLRMLRYSLIGLRKSVSSSAFAQWVGGGYEACPTVYDRAIATTTATEGGNQTFLLSSTARGFFGPNYIPSFFGYSQWAVDSASCQLYMRAEIVSRKFMIISSGRSVGEEWGNIYGVESESVLESRDVGTLAPSGIYTVTHSEIHTGGVGGFASPLQLHGINCTNATRKDVIADSEYHVTYKFADTP